jgi:hypothetical protein
MKPTTTFALCTLCLLAACTVDETTVQGGVGPGPKLQKVHQIIGPNMTQGIVAPDMTQAIIGPNMTQAIVAPDMTQAIVAPDMSQKNLTSTVAGPQSLTPPPSAKANPAAGPQPPPLSKALVNPGPK